jgi:putative transposase
MVFYRNLAERQNNHLLVERIDSLRTAFRYVKERMPFQINAVVIMPDHLHCIWTLPPDDTGFSIRWNLLKGHFSRSIAKVKEFHKAEENDVNAAYGARLLYLRLELFRGT